MARRVLRLAVWIGYVSTVLHLSFPSFDFRIRPGFCDTIVLRHFVSLLHQRDSLCVYSPVLSLSLYNDLILTVFYLCFFTKRDRAHQMKDLVHSNGSITSWRRYVLGCSLTHVQKLLWLLSYKRSSRKSARDILAFNNIIVLETLCTVARSVQILQDRKTNSCT